MTIDIDSVLERGDFSVPLLAEFILDKYEDIQNTDPAAAKKIEEQAFTPAFIQSVLSWDRSYLKSRLFRLVPAQAFSDFSEQIAAHALASEMRGGLIAAIRVLKAVSEDLFRKVVTRLFENSLAGDGLSAQTFSWLEFFHDLPRDLQENFFDRGMDLMMENLGALKSDKGMEWVLAKSLDAALCLEAPEMPVLARNAVRALVDDYDPEDSSVFSFCFDLFNLMISEADSETDDFELDLFFQLESGRINLIPGVVDRCYAPEKGSMPLSKAYADFMDRANVSEFMPGEAFGNEVEEPPLKRVFREVGQDKDLMAEMGKKELTRSLALVEFCLEWKKKRRTDVDLQGLTDEDLMDYLTLDTRDKPFKAELRAHIGQMAPERRALVLTQSLACSIEHWNECGFWVYATATIIQCMCDTGEPDYLPVVVQSFRWETDIEDDAFFQDIITGACRFGDVVFDHFDNCMEEIREDRLIDILAVVRSMATPRAETFLLAHFDQFSAAFRADTMDAFTALISRKALDMLAHKVGKNQRQIDELYVIVNLFEGNDGPEVQRLLENLSNVEQEIQDTLKAVESNAPRDVMRLELKCSNCGDISHYDCRNIILSPQGEGYVAEELTCVNCNEISEFDIDASGRYAIQAEAIRVFGTDEDQPPFPGAVKILNTAFMGRPMSLIEGIALYKEKIRKNPGNPAHYIGLGNVYRTANQSSLARQQYEKAIELGPFYIESYLSLARLEEKNGEPAAALDWLQKGRRYLKRPLICKEFLTPAEEILAQYRDLHFDLIMETGSALAQIRDEECVSRAASLKKIGPNEKCPCGSGKKYKKCCKRKRG